MRRLLSVIVVALFATALTGAAAADPLPEPAAGAETPLRMVPSKPLELAPAHTTSSRVGWKLLGLAAAAGVGLWMWKRRGPRANQPALPDLRIVRRTSIGVRSELLLVELDGQRLLLGVTPNSIQNLYIVPDEAPQAEPAAQDEGEPSITFARRLAGVLEAVEPAREPSPRPAPSPRASRKSKSGKAQPPAAEPPVEGQARGLLAVGGRE